MDAHSQKKIWQIPFIDFFQMPISTSIQKFSLIYQDVLSEIMLGHVKPLEVPDLEYHRLGEVSLQNLIGAIMGTWPNKIVPSPSHIENFLTCLFIFYNCIYLREDASQSCLFDQILCHFG